MRLKLGIAVGAELESWALSFDTRTGRRFTIARSRRPSTRSPSWDAQPHAPARGSSHRGERQRTANWVSELFMRTGSGRNTRFRWAPSRTSNRAPTPTWSIVYKSWPLKSGPSPTLTVRSFAASRSGWTEPPLGPQNLRDHRDLGAALDLSHDLLFEWDAPYPNADRVLSHHAEWEEGARVCRSIPRRSMTTLRATTCGRDPHWDRNVEPGRVPIAHLGRASRDPTSSFLGPRSWSRTSATTPGTRSSTEAAGFCAPSQSGGVALSVASRLAGRSSWWRSALITTDPTTWPH